MNLIQEAYQRLFTQRQFSYLTKLEYNRRLDHFNANIKLDQTLLQVNLNLNWKDIDEEIKIGLIQHLLLKIFKNKNNNSKIGILEPKNKSTYNLQLYHNFIKEV